MEKQLNLKFVHNRKNNLSKAGKALVQLRIHYLGQKKTEYKSTGIYIKPNQWDNIKQEVNSKCPGQERYLHNQLLEKIKADFNSLELQANYKNEKITPDKLKAGVKSSGLTVASFYQEWIETNKTFKPNTLKNQELFVVLAV